MTARSVFGKGPQTKAACWFYMAMAGFWTLTIVTLKAYGWLDWMDAVVFMIPVGMILTLALIGFEAQREDSIFKVENDGNK